MNLDAASPSTVIKQNTALEKKLDAYFRQAGIKDQAKARLLVQRHFSAHADEYPYVLFRGRTLYLFTVGGLSAAEQVSSLTSADYLRFDGERITQLDPQYYLGPAADVVSSSDDWMLGGSNNNNNNNNNNGNNGNNGNNNG